MSTMLKTEITIDAPAERVWQILIDLDRWQDWNPFITRAAGTVELGQQIDVTMAPEGSRPVRFRPVVTEATEPRVFSWLGHLGVRGIFDGAHRFEIHETGAGSVRFVHAETFSGVLPRLMGKWLTRTYRPAFESMNEALRRQAEETDR
jgi:hypothetical protein